MTAWLVIGIALGASALGLAAIAWRDRNVVGYEDDEGFHHGKPPDDSLDVLEEPPKRRQGERW